jgi:hypothetical protein
LWEEELKELEELEKKEKEEAEKKAQEEEEQRMQEKIEQRQAEEWKRWEEEVKQAEEALQRAMEDLWVEDKDDRMEPATPVAGRLVDGGRRAGTVCWHCHTWNMVCVSNR